MRVVVTGASGNVGTSVVRALLAAPEVDEVVGIARRLPSWEVDGLRWATANVATDDLTAVLHGADAVVHLAWIIQPSHDDALQQAVNVGGSERVFAAAAAAGVRTLVHMSSVGAYSPAARERDRRIDESWPTDGTARLAYSWQKAYVERLVDRFETEHPEIRVVRFRPSLIFKRDAAEGIRKLFLAPLPVRLTPADALTRLLEHGPFAFQCVHTDDVAAAFRAAVVGDGRGAFNLASEPVIGRDIRPVGKALAAGASLTWRLHLQATAPGWIHFAMSAPLLDTARARQELGWAPTVDARATLHELLAGLHARTDFPTPPLQRSGPTEALLRPA